MDRTEFDGALTDVDRQTLASVDAELRRALAVEPAPDFAARLRSRLSAAPRRLDFWMVRSIPIAAAAGLAVAVGVTLIDRQGDTPEVSEPIAVVQNPQWAPLSPPVAAARTAAPKPRAVPRSTARSAAAGDPLVLVLPGQEEALRQFAKLLNEGRVDLASVRGLADQLGLVTVPSIQSTIVPVTIEPLFPMSAGEKPDPSVKEE